MKRENEREKEGGFSLPPGWGYWGFSLPPMREGGREGERESNDDIGAIDTYEFGNLHGGGNGIEGLLWAWSALSDVPVR
jgi:hypothetical protein